MPKIRLTGFTLAEVLIALVILGEIATFTIPKVLSAQQNGQNKAVAKEVAAMIASAYQQAQLDGIVTTSTTMGNITQYMNYVSIHDTAATKIDGFPTYPSSTVDCSTTYLCLRLHNGAIFMVDINAFTTTSGIIDAVIDVDGRVTSQKDSIAFVQYYNGRIATFGNYAGNTAHDPDWFSW